MMVALLLLRAIVFHLPERSHCHDKEEVRQCEAIRRNRNSISLPASRFCEQPESNPAINGEFTKDVGRSQVID